MKESIEQFILLQSIDHSIDGYDDRINKEQEKLDEQNGDLVQNEQEIAEMQTRCEELEKEQRTLEAEVEDGRLHAKDRQSKMMQIQTGREQTALLKEIEDVKKGIKEKEEKLVSIMEESETLVSQIEDEGKQLQEDKERLVAMAADVKKEISSIKRGRTTEEKKRKKQVAGVDARLLKKYDLLRERRNGLAIVNVLGGVCQGCFMSIPPQQYNLMLRGDKIFDCPTCMRLMYHRPVAEEG